MSARLHERPVMSRPSTGRRASPFRRGRSRPARLQADRGGQRRRRRRLADADRARARRGPGGIAAPPRGLDASPPRLHPPARPCRIARALGLHGGRPPPGAELEAHEVSLRRRFSALRASSPSRGLRWVSNGSPSEAPVDRQGHHVDGDVAVLAGDAAGQRRPVDVHVEVAPPDRLVGQPEVEDARYVVSSARAEPSHRPDGKEGRAVLVVYDRGVAGQAEKQQRWLSGLSGLGRTRSRSRRRWPRIARSDPGDRAPPSPDPCRGRRTRGSGRCGTLEAARAHARARQGTARP